MGFMDEDILRDDQGRLLPGHKGLKPKGATGRLQSEIKAKITEFLNGKLETLEDVYSQVSPKDKLNFLSELLAYVVPKSKELFIDDARQPNAVVDYSKLSESTLKEILTHTTIKHDEQLS